ncbi:hemerythrin domain-containing protein [uncultured Thiodictyon sp.]|uniref:hemerythrin domain-containing protein n=1 Tax=uncultured Thiodictyon sp. TaxID=1846217 RepID=UPI0025EAAC11|nr:hemerythrin domain-containing protein [uncultured Thiodictyon sp.]
MHPLMQRLAQDHLRQTQLLDLFDVLLERFHAGHEPDYELFCQMLEYMDSYADTIHHPTEDLIFRRTLEKGAEQRDVFDVLMRQHGIVIHLNKRFRRSLDGIVHEEVLLRDEVEAQGREFVATMREHLSLEDTEAFPIARKWLETADWDALDALAPRADDPVFGTPDPQRFRALFQHLSAQAQD